MKFIAPQEHKADSLIYDVPIVHTSVLCLSLAEQTARGRVIGIIFVPRKYKRKENHVPL